MSIKPVIQAKTAAILEKEAEHYGVTATAMAKAILDTVCREGLVHTMLVGVDVESFQIRGRRRSGKAQSGRKPRQLGYALDGEPVSLEYLSTLSGLPKSTIKNRIKRGLPVEQALSVRDFRIRNSGVAR